MPSRQVHNAIGTPTRPSTPGRLTVPTPVLVRAHVSTGWLDETRGGGPSRGYGGDDPELRTPGGCRVKGWETFLGRRKAVRPVVFPFEHLRSSLSPSAWSLYAGLYTAAEALLKVCSAPHHNRGAGTRSLFSTCLRQIPAHLKEEQLWLAEEAEHGAQVSLQSTDIYSELENALSATGQGWKPLREIVKADGLSLICDGIKEGLFLIDFVTALVDLCTKFKSFDEAESLLDSLLVAHAPAAPHSHQSSSSGISRALSALKSYVDESDRRRYCSRRLASMLGERQIAAQVLAQRDYRPMWDRAIRSMCRREYFDPDLWAFLEAVFYAALELPLAGNRVSDKERIGHVDDAQRPTSGSSHPTGTGSNDVSTHEHGSKDALDNMIRSLVEILSAMAILGKGPQGSGTSTSADRPSGHIARFLAGIALAIQKMSLDEVDDAWRERVGQRARTAILASILVSSFGSARDMHKLESFEYPLLSMLTFLMSDRGSSVGRDERSSRLDSLAGSTASIARLCSRAVPESECDYVMDVGAILVRLSDCADADFLGTRGQDVLYGVIFKTASLFLDHSALGDWAADLVARFDGKVRGWEDAITTSNPSDHPASPKSPVEDWEEDLCEKFATTPGFDSSRQRRHSADSVFSDGSPTPRGLVAGGIDPQSPTRSHPRLSALLLGSSPSPIPRVSNTSRTFSQPLAGAGRGISSGQLFALETKPHSGRDRAADATALRRVSTAEQLPIVYSKPSETKRTAPSGLTSNRASHTSSLSTTTTTTTTTTAAIRSRSRHEAAKAEPPKGVAKTQPARKPARHRKTATSKGGPSNPRSSQPLTSLEPLNREMPKLFFDFSIPYSSSDDDDDDDDDTNSVELNDSE